MDKNTRVISFTVPDELNERIEVCASMLHLKKSEFVRQALIAALKGINDCNNTMARLMQVLGYTDDEIIWP